ncbi:MAG: TlpA disulfide reductase family protein, partial [Gemmatimonadota bacterium]
TGEAGVRSFVAERGVTYPIAMATPALIRAFGGYRGLPTSILIDREGRIRYRITGYYVEPALRAAVGRLLREPGEGAALRVPGDVRPLRSAAARSFGAAR